MFILDKEKIYINIISSLPIIFFLIILIILYENQEQNKKRTHLNIIYKKIETISDIEPITTPNVKPIVYINTISLRTIPFKKRKKIFIDLLLPSILIKEYKIKNLRTKLLAIKEKLYIGENLTYREKILLNQIQKKYKAKNINEILNRVNTLPVSMVLAQAAIESGWGVSRFFEEGNNIFGIWSFNPNEERIKALGTRNGKSVYLKKYGSLLESISDYFLLINTGRSFAKLRNERNKNGKLYDIMQHLTKYSELGYLYVKHLITVIEKNDLKKYDNYQISPYYIFIFTNKPQLPSKGIEKLK